MTCTQGRRVAANPGLIYTTPLGSRAYDLIRARSDAPSENDDLPLFSEITFGNRYNSTETVFQRFGNAPEDW